MKQLSSRIGYESPWLRIREDEVELLDGSHSIYSVVERKDFAVVLPRTDDGFWLVDQFRYPLQERTLEFPQGAWPHGKTGSSLDLAKAELAEETGFRAETFVELGTVYHSVGSSAQRYVVYLATGLTPGERSLEPSELGMEVRFVSDAELAQLVADNVIRDAATLVSLTLYRSHLDRSA